jgi:hypothetical protein
MEKVISLTKHKIKIAEKLIQEAIETGDYDYDFVDDEFLMDHAKSCSVNLESLLQTVWMLAESMDKLEFQFLQFKLDIINLLNGEVVQSEK